MRRLSGKRLLILVGGLLGGIALLGLLAVTTGPRLLRGLRAKAWTDDPVLAARSASQILSYTAPPGWSERKVLVLQGAVRAVLVTSRSQPEDALMLARLSAGLADPRWRGSILRSATRTVVERGFDVRETGTWTASVRGEPAVVQMFEGRDQDGKPVKQAALVVRGHGSAVTVVLVQSASRFDPALLDRFLASIR